MTIAAVQKVFNMVPAPNIFAQARSETDRKIIESQSVKDGLSTGAKIVGGIATGLGVISKGVAVLGLETGPAMPIVEGVAAVASIASAVLGGVAGII